MSIGDVYQQAVGKYLPTEIMGRLRFRVGQTALHSSQHLTGAVGGGDYVAVVYVAAKGGKPNGRINRGPAAMLRATFGDWTLAPSAPLQQTRASTMPAM